MYADEESWLWTTFGHMQNMVDAVMGKSNRGNVWLHDLYMYILGQFIAWEPAQADL